MAKLTLSRNLPRAIGPKLTKLRHIATSMQGNAYFPNPPVPIATFLDHIALTEAAQAVMLTRVDTARTDRDAKLAVVLADLDQLLMYVTNVARQNPEAAFVIVASAGLDPKGYRKPGKPSFRVGPGRVSGSVRLSTRHPGIVASFEWQYSTDGTHWIEGASTTQSSTPIEGLTPGTTYSFRYRVLTHAGKSDWSNVLTFLVT